MKVCHDARIAPELQPMTTEVLEGATANSQNGAGSDTATDGLWGSMLQRYANDQRVGEIEHATFTPAVLSATGGLTNEANTLYKR